MSQNLIEKFITLVKIDSPSGDESNVAKYIKSWSKKVGLSSDQDKTGNLFVYKYGMGEPVLICAHMDTVEPGRGIEPCIENGIIKSSGNTILGADNKAAIASILQAVEDKWNGESSIELLFTVREESGGGVENFDISKVKSKYGLIFDLAKNFGYIALSSPEIINFQVSFFGQSAHASTPKLGKNALVGAVEFVNLISSLGGINLGKFQSGEAINAVPAIAVVEGEIRSNDKKTFDQTLSNLKQAADIIKEKNNLGIEVATSGYCSGYNLSRKHFAVQQAVEILKKQKIQPKFIHSKGVSDSNVLIPAGLPVVTLSDGVSNPHTTDESISVQNLDKLNNIIRSIL